MKVIVEEKTELGYPKLMISGAGQVIMALSEIKDNETLITGFVIEPNGHPVKGNGYSDDFIKSKLKDFNGTITLSND